MSSNFRSQNQSFWNQMSGFRRKKDWKQYEVESVMWKLSVFFEPTDRRKAVKALQTKQYKIRYASPNISELRAMAQFLEPNIHVEVTSDINEITNLSRIVTEYIEILIITMGNKGVTTVSHHANKFDNTDNKKLNVRYYPVDKVNDIENVSGAGDCFASGFILGMLSGFHESLCVTLGFEAARSALMCKSTIPVDFQISSNLPESPFQTF